MYFKIMLDNNIKLVIFQALYFSANSIMEFNDVVK